jgi:hypothetical protein
VSGQFEIDHSQFTLPALSQGKDPRCSGSWVNLVSGVHFLEVTHIFPLPGTEHRNSRTFPVESLAHDSGCTLVRAGYGHPKGSPNTNR